MTLWDGLYRPSGTYPLANLTQGGTRVCPTCRGTGINPVWISKLCPKCHGERKVLA